MLLNEGRVTFMLNVHSQYARFFDESCEKWTKDREINISFLKTLQTRCNDLLKYRGYLFLSDVYEKLGIPITEESCIVGWMFEEPNEIGDNFVQFIYDETDESACILIDFNVDGDIFGRLINL